jgi:N-acetylglucosamine-6-phosphate deacetylase
MTLTSPETSRGSYVDLQINGYMGIDFNDPEVSVDQLVFAANQLREHGVHMALPTIITGALDAMCRCLASIVAAVERDETAASVFRGVHIEGPFLSRQTGYIGAHPAEHARRQDLTVLEQLLAASGGLARIVTLAPEVDQGGAMTALCREREIVVAAGHTDASLVELESCIDAGLSLFTHLGNGCPRLMDRHDNIIYRALTFRDRLNYSLIADGFHVPAMLFEHFLQWIPRERLIVVSDAISAAGLGPGTYQLGQRVVQVGFDKCARDASGEHFVGAASTMSDAEAWLTQLGLGEAARKALLCENPLSLVGLS